MSLQFTPSGGSVTSVGLTATPGWLTVNGSPITSSGNITLSAATGQAQNQFLATPNGSTGAVGLRSISLADLPPITMEDLTDWDGIPLQNEFPQWSSDIQKWIPAPIGDVIGQGAGVSISVSGGVAIFSNTGVLSLTAGSGVSLSGSTGSVTISATGSGGTVTSVGLSAPAWLSVGGSPVTTSGTLSLTAAAGQTANQFLATPNGSTGAVGLRAIAAADLPLISLTAGVSGVLPIANGGTNLSSAGTNDQILGVVHSGSGLEYKSLTAGSGVSISAAAGSITISATGSGGTVTSVGLTTPSWLTVTGSPITGSGTLAVSATSGQTANQVLATPNGTTGAVGLRSLVAADIPALSYVTSVGATVPSWLTVSGSPITSSGTLAITATSGQTANQFLATPNGSSGSVGLRAIVAADLPAISLTSGVSGILPTANGGTGSNITTPSQGSLLYANSSNVFTTLAPGTSNQVLTTGGSSANPAWSNIESLATASTGIAISGTTSLSIRAKRPLVISLMTAFTPSGTGGDAYEVVVPYSPTDGTTSLTYNLRRLQAHLGTASTSGSVTMKVESSNAGTTTAFASGTVTNMMTGGDLSLTSGTYTGATETFSTATVTSGTLLRINVTGLGTGTANWSVDLILEEN